MHALLQQLKQMLMDTRKEWLNEMVSRYHLPQDGLWKYYGYQSPDDLARDLNEQDELLEHEQRLFDT
ncbi:hypothetical protein ACRTDO_13520 [Vibrio furnissii]|uniref:hypothetical protein n=1 Tax=Vibrio TaxID=662 RepID=UPI0012AE7709|nr:hypothetical protein [Vibrio furnissii]